MACILNIETATNVCSVVVSKDGELVFEKIEYEGPSHSSLLGVFVAQAIEATSSKALALDAVAVSSGPGSYTGLRIGVSLAKGLCFGSKIPLIAIPTLEVLAMAVISTHNLSSETLLCPMIDARRMEVYDAFYDKELNLIREVQASIIEEGSYSEVLEKSSVLFFGNGAAKCQDFIGNVNSEFLPNIHPLAKNMVSLAEKKFQAREFEDLAYYEPFYLKEFIATKPKNKVLPL